MGSRVTLADVADRAGVSPATVSLVLSGKEGASVRPDTFERIIAAARDLGYHRKPQSKPQGGKTGNIGYLIPVSRNTDNAQTYHIRRFYTGVMNALAGQNFQVLQAVVEEEGIPDLVRQGKVDGVIVHSICDPQWVSALAQVVPVVWLTAYHPFVPVDACLPDNVEGMHRGLQYLTELGHRRIAVFYASKLGLEHGERLRAYLRAVKALQLPFCKEYLALYEIQWQQNSEDMKVVMTDALEKLLRLPAPPTAVVALSDFDAALLIRTALSMGLNVPGDLSVLGFDDISLCDYLHPGLTSVHQPMEEIGAKSCQLLLERIHGDTRPFARVRLGMSIVERDSTAPPPATAP